MSIFQHISCPRTCLININEQICAVTAVLCDVSRQYFKTKTTSIFPVDGVYGYYTEANCKYIIRMLFLQYYDSHNER